jgi:hypothetical protein
MNIMEIGALGSMLGKSVEIDGVSVGCLADMSIEQTIDGIKIHADIVPTDESIDKLREYSIMMSIMDEKPC